MTNAPVNSVGMESGMLTQTKTLEGAKAVSSSKQDFGKIMSQTKEKTQQAEKINAKQNASNNPKQEKTTDVSEESKAAQDKPVAEGEKQQVTAKEKSEPEVKKKQPKEPDKSDVLMQTQEIDEETLEVIAQTVQELMQEVADILNVSEEELQALMEEVGLEPMDLLNLENMVPLALAAEGEDSVIGIVMNETIYDNLQALVQTVEEELTAMSEMTEISPEELEKVLEQLKQLASKEPEFTESVMTTNQETQDMEEIPVLVRTEQKQETVVSDTTLENTQQAQQEALSLEQAKQSGNKESMMEEEQAEEKHPQQELTNFQQNVQQTQQTEQTAEIPDTMTTDSAPSTDSILKQLTDSMKLQTGKEMTEIELQLHPASLGTVNVQLTTRGGIVTAHMTTQSEAVKNVIEAQVVTLRNNLEEQGIKVEAIEVSVASHEMEKNLEQGTQDKQQQEEEQKTGVIKKMRRANINLNAWANGDGQEDMEMEDVEAVQIAKEMMEMNGNTMDLLA